MKKLLFSFIVVPNLLFAQGQPGPIFVPGRGGGGGSSSTNATMGTLVVNPNQLNTNGGVLNIKEGAFLTNVTAFTSITNDGNNGSGGGLFEHITTLGSLGGSLSNVVQKSTGARVFTEYTRFTSANELIYSLFDNTSPHNFEFFNYTSVDDSNRVTIPNNVDFWADRRVFFTTLNTNSTPVSYLGKLATGEIVETSTNRVGGGSGSQTPWLQDIDGALFNLTNVGYISLGTNSVLGGIIVSNNPSTGVSSMQTSNSTTSKIYQYTATAGIGTSTPTNLWDVVGNTSLRANLFLPVLPTNGSPTAFLAVDAGGQVYETAVVSGAGVSVAEGRPEGFGQLSTNGSVVTIFNKFDRTKTRFFAAGDSLTSDITKPTWYFILTNMPGWNDLAFTTNSALSGSGMDFLTNNFATNVALFLKFGQSSATNDIYAFWIGANDSMNDAYITAISNHCYQVQSSNAAGIIIFTVTSATTTLTELTESNKFKVNTAIRRGFAGITNYYVVDIASMFPDPFDTTYYVDGLHLNAFAQARLGRRVDSVYRVGPYGDEVFNAVPAWTRSGTNFILRNSQGVGIVTIFSDGTSTLASPSAITNNLVSGYTFTNKGVYMPVAATTTTNLDWVTTDVFTNNIAAGITDVSILFSNVTANRQIQLWLINQNVATNANITLPATVRGLPVTLVAWSNSPTVLSFATFDGKTNGFLVSLSPPQTTNDFVSGQTYTNSGLFSPVSATIRMTNLLSTDFAKMNLWIDQDGDGTFEVKGVSVSVGGVALVSETAQLVGFIQPNGKFAFTNQSGGTATASIEANSSLWPRQ